MSIVTSRRALGKISKLTNSQEVEDLKIVERIKEALKTGWVAGHGLAAVQIGVPIRAAWYKLPDGTENTLINPEILKVYDVAICPKEGCLSVPDVWIPTVRYQKIKYKNNGNTFTAKGVEAHVIQHEVDHMNGMLHYDRRWEPSEKIGRNSPCPCGSGKKYKKCCLGDETKWLSSASTPEKAVV